MKRVALLCFLACAPLAHAAPSPGAALAKTTKRSDRLRLLADVVAAQAKKPTDDPTLVKALKLATYDEDVEIRRQAAAALALMSGVSRKAVTETVQLMISQDDEPIDGELYARLTAGTEGAYVLVSKALRQAALEDTGASHRLRARCWTVRLALGRQWGWRGLSCADLRGAGGEAQTLVEALRAPSVVARIQATYRLAGEGSDGAAALLAALAEPVAPTGPALRLVAANALQLTGAIPSDAQVDQLAAVTDAETDRMARIEALLALATFAERSPHGYERFKERLLALGDCPTTQAVALSLPSHDLRLKLYKRLPASGRAGDVRRWVWAKAWQRCK